MNNNEPKELPTHVKDAPNVEYVHGVNSETVKLQPKENGGRYPDNYSAGKDMCSILLQLLEISPGLIVGQAPNSMFGTITIRFRDRTGAYHYVGFIDISNGEACLWHPRFFPDGKKIQPK